MRRCLFFFVILTLAGLASGNLPVQAQVPRYGDSAITPILVDTSDGPHVQCSAVYVAPAGAAREDLSPAGAWILTAGHCADATLAPDPAYGMVFGLIDWRVTMRGDPGLGERVFDFALGTVPEVRERDWRYHPLGERMPRDGVVWIYGFPLGAERITPAEVVGACGPEGDAAGACDDLVGSVALLVWHGQIQPGSSGSAVLDEQGRVVGIVWGVSAQRVEQDYDIVVITPVEAIRQAISVLGGGPHGG